MRRALVLALGLAAAPPAPAIDPRPDERGLPGTRMFTTRDTGAGVQSFDFAQDRRGRLIVGNLWGVAIYDGVSWSLAETPAAVYRVAVHPDGRIAAGGVDEIGLIETDAQGVPQLRSLRQSLPSLHELGDVIDILPADDGFVFLADHGLLRFRADALELVERSDPALGKRAFAAAGEVYLWSADAGLRRLEASGLRPVSGGEAFRGRRVDALLPTADGLLMAVRGEGLFWFVEGQRPRPAPAAASRFVRENPLTGGVRLADGRYALGSRRGGLLLLTALGVPQQHLDAASGLPDDSVLALFEDREGGLWLSLDAGLARVEVASPLSVHDGRVGLRGAANALHRHQGLLHVGTSVGAFVLKPSAGGVPRFEPLRGLDAPAWSFASAGHELVIGTSAGVWVQAGTAMTRVPETAELTIYSLGRSARPDQLWLGTRDGLARLRRGAGGWRYAGPVPGLPRYVRSIVERPGALWLGSTFDGVTRLPLTSAAEPSGTPTRLGQGEMNIRETPGQRLLVTRDEGGVLAIDPLGPRLVSDAQLAALTGHAALDVAADAAGNVWISSAPPRVALPALPGAPAQARALPEIDVDDFQALHADQDGVVWFGSHRGLYRHAGLPPAQRHPLPAPALIRLAVDGQRRPDTGGALALAADFRSLQLALAPGSLRGGLVFERRLDPRDDAWTAATGASIEYRGLRPGLYTLRVRTRGSGQETSPEAVWLFEVLPPWHRRPAALALFLTLAALLVTAWVRHRSRALAQRSRELEALVTERTEELRRAVLELEVAQRDVQTHNRLLEAANARLESLSLRDALTGVANRRCLDQVLLAEWSRARRSGEPLALLLLDLDHFKALNDQRGHPEGDAALQAVAHWLERAVQRSGDLVARYGGEEFVVVLPGLSEADAAAVAERLRQGVADLALAHPGSSFGCVTVSVGVAALAPEGGEPPERLLAGADRALYKAKSRGRNQVARESDP